MVIDPKSANEFIKGYKSFLLYAGEFEEEGAGVELLNQLVEGRDVYLQDRSLLEKYREQKEQVTSWVIEAIQQIEVTEWVYLRDTTKYSLFIRADQTAAYAVQGLTDPINEIFGRSGIYMKTGVFPFFNKFVCDGLVMNFVSLGKNYREEINETYRELRKDGCFYKSPVA